MVIGRNYILAIVLAWRGNSFAAKAEIVNTCVKNFDPIEDYFPAKYVKPTITSYGNLDITGEKFVPHNVSILVALWLTDSFQPLSLPYYVPTK